MLLGDAEGPDAPTQITEPSQSAIDTPESVDVSFPSSVRRKRRIRERVNIMHVGFHLTCSRDTIRDPQPRAAASNEVGAIAYHWHS